MYYRRCDFCGFRLVLYLKLVLLYVLVMIFVYSGLCYLYVCFPGVGDMYILVCVLLALLYVNICQQTPYL